jgi:hypothetical protein
MARPVGRPRKPASQQAKTAEGYTQQTVGPRGNSRRVYTHRQAMGLGDVKGSKAGGKVVDHLDGNRTGKFRQVVSKATNSARSNRKRAR